MIVSAASIGSDWFLNGVANLQRQQVKTEQQLSSGYQVQTAADSPSQTPALIDGISSLASYQAYQTNLNGVQAEANAADSALGASINLLDSARSLATEGAGTNASAAEYQNLAMQVQSLQSQLVSAANTTVQGRYIFGGDQDQSPPYQLDSTSATGVDQLTSQTTSRVVLNPAGETIYQPLTAAAIFDPTDEIGAPTAGNTFAALQQLVTALQNDDPTGTANAIVSLQSASNWLNQQQASYGVAEQRITSEQNSAANEITALQSQISAIRDTNMPQAATDLTQETTAQSAAFAAQAQIPTKSLFDYLG